MEENGATDGRHFSEPSRNAKNETKKAHEVFKVIVLLHARFSGLIGDDSRNIYPTGYRTGTTRSIKYLFMWSHVQLRSGDTTQVVCKRCKKEKGKNIANGVHDTAPSLGICSNMGIECMH